MNEQTKQLIKLFEETKDIKQIDEAMNSLRNLRNRLEDERFEELVDKVKELMQTIKEEFPLAEMMIAVCEDDVDVDVNVLDCINDMSISRH